MYAAASGLTHLSLSQRVVVQRVNLLKQDWLVIAVWFCKAHAICICPDRDSTGSTQFFRPEEAWECLTQTQ